MKRMLLLLVFFGFSLAVRAQQDPQFAFYMYDQLSYNPASAGIKGNICFTPIYRSQWMGSDLAGSPQSFLFNYEMPVSVLHGGVGLTYINDALGQENNNIVRLHYSYQMPLFNGKLGAGVSYGIFNKALGNDWLTPSDPVSQDLSIDGNKTSGTNAVDIAFGLHYYEPDLYLGVSATHLAPGDIPEVNMKTQTHVYINGGKNFNAPNGTDKIRSNFLVKTDLRAAVVDLSVDYLMANKIWAGATYRFSDAVIPNVGYITDLPNGHKLQVGVAYGIGISQLKSYHGGTLEVMAKYCFLKSTPVPSFKYHNVRNL